GLWPTAMQAHLCESGQDAGFACLWAQRRGLARLLLDTEEEQEHRRPLVWGHVHFLESAMDLGRDILRAVGLRHATVVPQQVERRKGRRRCPIGETAAGAIR